MISTFLARQQNALPFLASMPGIPAPLHTMVWREHLRREDQNYADCTALNFQLKANTSPSIEGFVLADPIILVVGVRL